MDIFWHSGDGARRPNIHPIKSIVMNRRIGFHHGGWWRALPNGQGWLHAFAPFHPLLLGDLLRDVLPDRARVWVDLFTDWDVVGVDEDLAGQDLTVY